jgi:hypothetical protein
MATDVYNLTLHASIAPINSPTVSTVSLFHIPSSSSTPILLAYAMGSCMSSPVPNVEVSEEEKLRNREIDKQLREVGL